MSKPPCPSQDELISFGVGKVPEVQAAEIAEHLEDCEDCQLVMETIDDAGDTLASGFRAGHEADQFEQEQACQRAVELVEEIGDDPSFTMTSDRVATAGLDMGRLRDYKLLAKLGEGGMGTVYKALHTRLKKVVAVKVLRAERMKDALAVARFEREMEAVGKLEHPNIVRAMDAGEHEGTHFLVIEHVNGTDLSEIIRSNEAIPIPTACELVRQAALGLQEAHEHGIVHRDIKPSNLMLAKQKKGPPIVKILDMGLALLGEAQSPGGQELTNTGQMMGTIDYMAPEQGGDSKNVDIRADIYALGATLYKLLTQEAIYHGEQYQTVIQKMMALANEPAPPVQERRRDVPDELAAIVHRMIAKKPDARFATPADVAAALAPFATGADLAALAGQRAASTSDRSKSLAGTDVGISRFDVDTKPTWEHAPEVSISGGGAVSSGAASPESERIPLEDTQSHAPPAPRLRSANAPWAKKSAIRRRVIIGTAIVVPVLIVLGFVLLLRTPDGRLRVEVNDENLEVTVDGEGITLTDKKWQGKKKARKHRLAIKLGDQTLNIGSPTVFEVDGREVEHRLKVKLSGVVLASNEFEVLRGEETVLKISLERQTASLKSAVAPEAKPSKTVLQLNGRDSSIEVPDFQYDGSHPLTVEAIVTVDGMPHAQPHLVDTTDERATRGFVLYIKGEYEKRKWCFSVRDPDDLDQRAD